MYELIQLSEHDYYVESPNRVGLVRSGDNRVTAIDSGGDASAGKKLRQILNAQQWTLSAILNTHSHADHIGGNRYLQGQTGCRIYASETECGMTRHPVLEPSLLWGGCPGRELRHKFLMAQESSAEVLTPEVLPEGMEILPLPGHSFEMVGFRTAEGTAYLADCLLSEETLTKYGIGFLWDVAAYLQTLETVKTLEANWYVPAHAPATREIASLAQKNIDAVYDAAERIEELCIEPIGFEELLKRVFTAYGLTMTLPQYALVGSTLRSYLSWMWDAGRITGWIQEDRLLWKKGS